MKEIPRELNLFRKKSLQTVMSVEAAECGLACLTMISRYHGHDVDLNSLRQRFSLSMAGANLKLLMEIADQLGFASRAVKCELEHLNHLALPAVLHWDLKHFVVLEKVKRGSIIIHDPALGRREVRLEEVSNHFTGVALEIEPTASFEPIKDRAPVRLTALWSSMQGFWRALIQVLALSVGLQVATFAMPFQLQLVVDEVLGRGDAQLLHVLAVGFAALVLLGALIEALRAYAIQVFGSLLNFQMVGNLVRHLLRLKVEFFEKRHVGDILSRIQSTRPIQQAISQGLVTVVIDGVMAVIALIIMFFYSLPLAMIVVVSVAINAIMTYAFYPQIRRRSEEQITATANEQSHVIESVRGSTTLRLWGGEPQRESHWRNLFASAVNASFSLGKLQLTQQALQSAITGLQTVLVLYVAAQIILAADGFSVGMLMAFLSFRQTFTDRINALINQALQFSLLGLHLERLGDILNATPERSENEEETGTELDSGIHTCGLRFRYGASDPLVLDGIDLAIQPGEFLAIIGPSGGGKTTLLKLILGLYEPTDGHIEIGSRRATSALWRRWRAQVAVVSQDDQLFSGTLADNIAFFDPDLNMDRVRQAAMEARIHDDIMRMPMQYMSLVGDMGSTLSGGQRQRVLFARALYRRPKVLVLDEGTANLDADTENEIADAITAMPITRIIVAHRPALVMRAERVLRMADGKLVDVSGADRRVETYNSSQEPWPEKPAVL
ncbi:peptidase domain-containing ABC transporter [Maricaulis sp. D1M11]|uniref:peptidase domain-containing ABC transporter n=1 Tax=Maricaulis sp. D1M11 TaxID=3076117 RepID=UPI0039B5A953